MALELMYKQFMDFASTAYKRSMARELNKMGLRYEDLMISETPAMREALSLADSDVVAGRMRRLKRASDLCFKAKNLQDYAPNMILEPFKMELSPDVFKLQARNEEYEILNLHKK